MQEFGKSMVFSDTTLGSSISHKRTQGIYSDETTAAAQSEKQDKEVRELVWQQESGLFQESKGKSFRVRVANGGTYCSMEKRNSERKTEQTGGGQRGDVLGFSRGSRKRLLRTMAKLDRSSIPHNKVLFITLTYDEDTEKNIKITGREYKRHLKNMTHSITRKFGGFGVWRYEEQKRLVGHFHLVWYNVRNIPHRWLAKRWNEITGGSIEHLSAGTQVERARSWKGVSIYGSKTMSYVGKDESTEAQRMHMRDIHIGRVWGVVNRSEYNSYVDMIESIHDDENVHNMGFRMYKNLIVSSLRKKGDYKGIKEFKHWVGCWEQLDNLNVQFYMENDIFIRLLEYMKEVSEDKSSLVWKSGNKQEMLDYCFSLDNTRRLTEKVIPKWEQWKVGRIMQNTSAAAVGGRVSSPHRDETIRP